eukprot:scaffold1311_cov256-Pinguiococcus_pyrenoidosus.AAC.78
MKLAEDLFGHKPRAQAHGGEVQQHEDGERQDRDGRADHLLAVRPLHHGELRCQLLQERELIDVGGFQVAVLVARVLLPHSLLQHRGFLSHCISGLFPQPHADIDSRKSCKS